MLQHMLVPYVIIIGSGSNYTAPGFLDSKSATCSVSYVDKICMQDSQMKNLYCNDHYVHIISYKLLSTYNVSMYVCTLYRVLIVSMLALLPLLCGTWILGLLFLIDSESEAITWIFTIINSLQVRS